MNLTGKIIIGICVAASISALAISFFACKKEEKVEDDPQYLKSLSQYPFWSNTVDTSIPEIKNINAKRLVRLSENRTA